MRIGTAYLVLKTKATDLNRGLAKAKRDTLDAANEMKRHAGIASAAIAGMIALVGKNVIKLGVDFEQSMKTVQAWSGATEQELKALTDQARLMGATTEWSAKQSADALKYLAAAGFTAQQSISALPGTLNLATAGQTDLATATDITTDTLTAFKMSVDELNRVNDAFINTTSNSNTNVLMMGMSMKYVAPTAKLFGLSIEEVSSMIGTLANSGIKAEQAGSGLNMVLLKSKNAAKKLGMDGMAPLIDVLKRMKEEQWNAVQIGEAFGARQVKTASILMDNIETYERLLKIQNENAGATQRLADIIRDSLGNDLKVLSSTIQEEALRAFDTYKEDIREIVQSTTSWVQANGKLLQQDIAGFVENITERLGSLFDLYERLPDTIVGVAGYGLVGRIMFGGKGVLLGVGYGIGKAIDDAISKASYAQNETIKKYNQEIAEKRRQIAEFEDHPFGSKASRAERLENMRRELFLLEAKRDMLVEEQRLFELVKQEAEELPKILDKSSYIMGDTVATTKELASELTVLPDMWEEWTSEAESSVKKVKYILIRGMDDLFAKQLPAMKSLPDMWEQWTSDAESSMATGGGVIRGMDDLFPGFTPEQLAALFDDADEIVGVFEALGQRIADVMAQAFQEIVDGTADLSATMSDLLKGVGQNLFSEGVKSGNWYMMAGGAAAMGVGTVMGNWGKQAEELQKLITSLENLSDSINSLGDDLDRQIFALENNDNQYALAIYDASKRFEENLKELTNITRGSRFTSSTESIEQTLMTNSGSLTVKAASIAFQSELDIWSNYIKEMFLATSDAIKSVTEFMDELYGYNTRFTEAMSRGEELYSNVAGAAQSILDSHAQASDDISYWMERINNIPAIDTAALERQATYQLPGTRDNPGAIVFDQELYDKLYADAVAERDNLIHSYFEKIGEIQASRPTNQMISDAEALLESDEAYFDKIRNEFLNERAGIFVDIDRYIKTTAGTATDLEVALWGVNDKFDSWFESVRNSFDPLTQMVEMTEALTEVEILRREAIDATIASMEEATEVEQVRVDTLARAIYDTNKLMRDISGGPLAPVSSAEFYTNQYDMLLAAALNAPDEDLASSMTALNNFIPEYLEYMQAYGGYKDITAQVLSDLAFVSKNAENRADRIDENWRSLLTYTEQIMLNTGIIASQPASFTSITVDETPTYIPTGYAAGGLTGRPTLAGEIGPEWVIPTYEPQRSNFLRDVGADPETIGDTIAMKLAPLVGSGGNINVALYIDGKAVRNAVTSGLRGRDPELINAVRAA